MENEIWKTCVQNPNYAVSDMGRVKRITEGHANTYIGKILKPSTSRGSYFQVCFWPEGKMYKVHKLVLTNFGKPKPKNMGCNHKNGRKQENYFENLEWKTQQYNLKHAFKTGLIEKPLLKLTPKNVREIRRLLKEGKLTQDRIAYRFNVSQATIYRVKFGICHSHVI